MANSFVQVLIATLLIISQNSRVTDLLHSSLALLFAGITVLCLVAKPIIITNGHPLEPLQFFRAKPFAAYVIKNTSQLQH